MLAKLIKLRLLGLLLRQSKRRKRGSTRSSLLLYGFVLLYCGGFFGYSFYQMFSQLAAGLVYSELSWYFFALAGIMAFALSLFFSIFTAKSELFEARDNELLLSLPIKPRTVLLSRISVLLLTQLPFALLVLIPAAVAWLSHAAPDGVQLALFVLGGLLLPLLGSALACLLGWLLALLTARVRNKSLLSVLFSLVFLAVYFLLFSRAHSSLQLLITKQAQISEGIAVWGFLFKWFGDGVAQRALVPFLGYAAVCVGGFALAVALISRSFVRIATQKTGARRRAGVRKRSYDALSVPSALLRRERKHFFSSPPYMLNCGLGLIFCLVGALALLLNRGSISAYLSNLQAQLDLPGALLVALGALAICFVSTMSPVTAPSVSIEGKSLWILRSLPVSARAVLAAKLKLHLLLCLAPTLALCAAVGLVLRPDALGWLLLLLLPLLMVLLIGAFGLMMNLLLPKLDWINETVAVKQSGAAILTIFAPMLYLGVFTVLLLTDAFRAQVLLSVCTALTGLLCALCLLWLRTRGAKRFERL